jgi:hypothetical protein
MLSCLLVGNPFAFDELYLMAFFLAPFLKVMLFRVIRFGARDSLVLDGCDRLSIFIVK